MNQRKLIPLLFGGALLAATGAGYAFKNTLSASAFFPSEKFKIIDIENRSGVVVISQALPVNYISSNVMIYRDCPYSDNAIWTYQDKDFIQVEYQVMGTVVASTNCPRDWDHIKAVDALLDH